MQYRFKKNFVRSILILFVLLSGVLSSKAQEYIVSLPNGSKVILHADKTWDYYKGISYDFDFSSLRDNQIPGILRSGISANKQILRQGVEMYLQGWRYTMPRPKSSQACWGNRDRRTTWWQAYWYNTKTFHYSRTTPQKQSNGSYVGDAQNDKGYWRNGGSPRTPSKIEWLLSESGGRKPY